MAGYQGGTAAADIARLRRMVAEPGTATYTDALLIAVMSNYPLADVTGEWPLLTTGSANTDWVGTYDLAAAAADIWDEKSNAFVDAFDFTADGATFHKSQVYAQYNKEARKWRSRRSIGGHELLAYPAQRVTDDWIGNINDPYE